MTTQPEPVHHLLDRLLRGVILPEEGEALAELVAELEAENSTLRDWLAHCPHKPRIAALEQRVAELTAEEREAADAYAAKLNTPPSAETLAFIAERIADGTAPHRKVRRRAAIDSPSDAAQQRETP